MGSFGTDNRAGIEGASVAKSNRPARFVRLSDCSPNTFSGTLHRISAMRNRRGKIVGLTCRVGRAVSGCAAPRHRAALLTRSSGPESPFRLSGKTSLPRPCTAAPGM